MLSTRRYARMERGPRRLGRTGSALVTAGLVMLAAGVAVAGFLVVSFANRPAAKAPPFVIPSHPPTRSGLSGGCKALAAFWKDVATISRDGGGVPRTVPLPTEAASQVCSGVVASGTRSGPAVALTYSIPVQQYTDTLVAAGWHGTATSSNAFVYDSTAHPDLRVVVQLDANLVQVLVDGPLTETKP